VEAHRLTRILRVSCGMADPLHGVTLEKIVTDLVAAYGFPELAVRIPIHCFENNPSVPSSLKFLRRTPWARAKVESFYLFHLRELRRRAQRDHARDLRGAASLVVGATQGVTDVVQDMHHAIGAFPILTDLVYAAVRGVTGIVGASIDAAVQGIAPLLGEGVAGPEREAVLAAINGVVGDHLARTKNPLAIEMSLRPPLEGLHRGGTLLVLVHGSCMNDLQWTADGHDHGRALASDLGFTPAYLHYNSGRHVSQNGEEFSALLARESEPFSDLVLVAHSMGGLVSRAAIHAAESTGEAWRHKLRALVTLGTPHHGAPLERGGNVLETILGITKYSAPLRALGEIRSAGVTDLRFGSVVQADWKDRDRFAPGTDPRTPTPLPEGVRCYAVAATPAAERPAPLAEADLPSDGLVPVPSALGHHADPAFALRFADTRIVWGTNHLGLISSREVYAMLRAWLAPAPQ
jgi:uncharacterized protein (DUF2132 family)